MMLPCGGQRKGDERNWRFAKVDLNARRFFRSDMSERLPRLSALLSAHPTSRPHTALRASKKGYSSGYGASKGHRH